MSLTAAIKAEIERQDLSAYRVAQLAGIKSNIVSRFLTAERDITLATADKIATALGLVVVRADELPAELPTARPVIDRRDYGAIAVWIIETSEYQEDRHA